MRSGSIRSAVAQTVAPPKALEPIASAGPQLWARALSLDFTRPWPGLLLAVLFVVSRLPWVTLGFGSDPDAWRVAMSARYLLEHAAYLPSRLPGYPLHDIVTAALLWGGWTLTNISTVAIALAGVFCFAMLVKRLGLPAPGLLAVTFAFLPLLWFTSSETLDYSWALTFLLAAYLSLLHRRIALGGLLLGLACGCRVTYLAFALPMTLLIWQDLHPRDVLRFLGLMLVTWFVLFAPVWIRYGLRFWNFYDFRPDWGDFLHALTEGSIGLLPLVVLGICLLLSWRRVAQLPAILRNEPQAAVWTMVALLALFIFVRLPLQTYYLMPAAPFALLLLARLMRRGLLILACVALLLAGFVDVYTTSARGWLAPSAVLHIRPTAGLMLQDYELRRQRLSLVRQVPDLPLPSGAVLTAGFYFPMVAELYHDRLQLALPDGYLEQVGPLTDTASASGPGGITYVWLLSQGDARGLLLDGREIYSLDFARETNKPLEVRIYRLENERFGIH